MIEPSLIEHLLLLSVEIYGMCSYRLGFLWCCVSEWFALCYNIFLLFLELSQDECEGLLCMYDCNGLISYPIVPATNFPEYSNIFYF